MRPATEVAKEVAAKIADDLNDRSGLGITSVEYELQKEILAEWSALIEAALSARDAEWKAEVERLTNELAEWKRLGKAASLTFAQESSKDKAARNDAINRVQQLELDLAAAKAEVERLKRDRARFFDGIMEQVDAVTEPELERDVRNLDGYISVWQRQKKQIAQLESELTALRVEVARHFCDVRKIREWLPTHKPAVMAFTSGPEREVADLIEQVRAELAAERGRWDFLNTELLAGRTYPITPEDGNRLNSLTPADAAEFLRELVDRLIQAKEQADG